MDSINTLVITLSSASPAGAAIFVIAALALVVVLNALGIVAQLLRWRRGKQ